MRCWLTFTTYCLDNGFYTIVSKIYYNLYVRLWVNQADNLLGALFFFHLDLFISLIYTEQKNLFAIRECVLM
ncbi:hypothetical protein ACJX0J_034712, partial [Zea mays]